MSSVSDRVAGRGRDSGWHRRVAIAIGVAAVGLVAIRLILAASAPATSFWAIDFHDYWLAGARVLHADIPYAPEMLAGPFSADGPDRYRYPPPFALVVAPLSALPPEVAAWVWLGVSVAGLVAGCYLAARAGGALGRIEWIVPLIVLVALAGPVYESLRVGNVEGVQILLIGVALAGSTSFAGAAVGALGVLKVYPVIAWPAAVIRDPRGAARGFALVAVVLLVTAPLLTAAWGAYPAVLANQWLGAAATDPGNLALPAIVARIAPDAPVLSSVARAATVVVAAALFIVSILWARRPDGWAGALLAALMAGLLIPGTVWLHYLALVLPFVVYAWSRLAVVWRVAFIVVFLALGLGGPQLRLVEELLLIVLVAVLLAHLRPARAGAAPAGHGADQELDAMDSGSTPRRSPAS